MLSVIKTPRVTIANNDITATIQLALAPVFLLTAVVMLITAISGRLARAIDRMRFIHAALSSPKNLEEQMRRHYLVEYHEVRVRGRLCAVAIFFDVLSGVLISLTVLELFFFEAGTILHLKGGFVVCTFVTGLLCFMMAMIIVLIEVVYAHRSTGWDMPIDTSRKD